MCMTGIGNSRRDYDRLLGALKELAAAGRSNTAEKNDANTGAALWTKHRTLHDVPIIKELIPVEQCEGRVCASSIIPYPPGIPLICPGEEIGQEEIDYVLTLRRSGEKVIGLDTAGRVAVAK